MKFMYLCENLVSTDHKSIMLYLHALGDTTEKEISFREVDFYLSSLDENNLPIDMVKLFENKNISTSNLKAVYHCKDPRLEHIFGIHKIKGVIKTRKEPRSYITCSYNTDSKSFVSKKFYLDKLINEIEYDVFGFLIKSAYYGHSNKNKPIIVSVNEFPDYTEIQYDNGSMKKNEYSTIKFCYETITTSWTSRQNISKEWYVINKTEKEYKDVLDLIDKIPQIDHRNFCNGNKFQNFLQH